MAWQRAHCCILLRDVVGEQTSNSYWWQVQKPQPAAVIVARGQLLVSISPEDSELNSSQEQTSRFRPKTNAGIIVECASEEVFWLSSEEQAILEAVESSETRFQEFCMDRKLKWAVELKVDAMVYLRLSDERRKTVAYAEGVVRYVGRVGSKLGRVYGVEITETKYRGLASCNGRFEGGRYFSCDDKCGEFVAVDSLSRKKEEHRQTPPLTRKHDATKNVHFSEDEFVIVDNKVDILEQSTVQWKETHETTETDVTVCKRASDAPPGLADRSTPNHSKQLVPENLELAQMSPTLRRKATATATGEQASQELAGVPKEKGSHRESENTELGQSCEIVDDMPSDVVGLKDWLKEEVSSLVGTYEQQLKQQEKQIARQQEETVELQRRLLLLTTEKNAVMQKLASTELQLLEQKAENAFLREKLQGGSSSAGNSLCVHVY